MFPVSGHHDGFKTLYYYVRGKPTNLWTSCWLITVSDHSSYSVSSSLKNETNACEHSYDYVSSSLKKEMNILKHSYFYVSILRKNEIGTHKHSYFLFQACVKMKHVTLRKVPFSCQAR